jgi:hypothetical protein
VAERHRLEVQGGDLTLTAASLLAVFEPERITHTGDVGASVTDDQQATALPHQTDVPCGVTGRVDDLESPRDWEQLTVLHLVVDPYRRDGLIRVIEQAKPDLLDQPRGWAHRPERSSALCDRRVRGVHPGNRARALDDGRRTSEVIGVGVRKNEVPEILRVAAQRSQRVKNLALVIGESRIDQGELAIVALEQHAVGQTEGQKPRPLDDLLHYRSLSLVRPAVISAARRRSKTTPSLAQTITYTMQPYER